MFKEFKEFAMKGSVLDLAIGVVVGGAFGKIVTSLVNDIIMPIIGRLLGKVDFSNFFISLDGTSYNTLAEAKEAGAATLNYGVFINTIIEFLIISFSLFLVIRQVNKLRRDEEVEQPSTQECEFCLSEIPIDASRCPYCTSVLEVEMQN